MSAVTESAIAVKRPYKLSFLKVLRSEWIKLFTLRSTWWIMVIGIVVNIGICVAMAAMMKVAVNEMANNPGLAVTAGNGTMTTTEGGGAPAPGSLGMLSSFVTQSCGSIGQLIFVILSILTITNEYSSGMIRSTLTVAPRRIGVLIAKMIVIAVLAVIVFAISVAAGWSLGYAILHGTTMIDLTVTSHLSLRIMGGFIIEMILVAWFCFGLGAWIRSTAGSIGAAVGIILVLPGILSMVVAFISSNPNPTGWRKWLIDGAQFLPTNAGSVITQSTAAQHAVLGPWEGIGVLGIWAVVALIIAFIVTARRDI